MGRGEVEARKFWNKVDIREPHECWPWKLSLDPHGRGQAWFEGRVQGAHRVAFKLANPEKNIDNLDIHHKDCESEACCNPDHLEDHTRWSHRQQHLKTHCKRGHEYTKENTYIDPRGHRECRECGNLRRSRK